MHYSTQGSGILRLEAKTECAVAFSVNYSNMDRFAFDGGGKRTYSYFQSRFLLEIFRDSDQLFLLK